MRNLDEPLRWQVEVCKNERSSYTVAVNVNRTSALQETLIKGPLRSLPPLGVIILYSKAAAHV